MWTGDVFQSIVVLLLCQLLLMFLELLLAASDMGMGSADGLQNGNVHQVCGKGCRGYAQVDQDGSLCNDSFFGQQPFRILLGFADSFPFEIVALLAEKGFGVGRLTIRSPNITGKLDKIGMVGGFGMLRVVSDGEGGGAVQTTGTTEVSRTRKGALPIIIR